MLHLAASWRSTQNYSLIKSIDSPEVIKNRQSDRQKLTPNFMEITGVIFQYFDDVVKLSILILQK